MLIHIRVYIVQYQLGLSRALHLNYGTKGLGQGLFFCYPYMLSMFGSLPGVSHHEIKGLLIASVALGRETLLQAAEIFMEDKNLPAFTQHSYH